MHLAVYIIWSRTPETFLVYTQKTVRTQNNKTSYFKRELMPNSDYSNILKSL